MSELSHNLESDDQTMLLSVDDQIQTHQPADDQGGDDLNPTPTTLESSGPRRKNKKKKNKGKKKKDDGKSDIEGEKLELAGIQFGSIDLSPFTSTSSVMQNKLKPLYHGLRISHLSNNVRLLQVVEFSNALVDARGDLQRRVDLIKRKFAIEMTLILNADRSSREKHKKRIRQLDFDKQRLIEDGSVYNHLTREFKISQAYKKMVEARALAEEEESCKLGKTSEDDFPEISFEELLAQEKKDTFWQKKWISR